MVKVMMVCLWCGGLGHAVTVDGKKCLSYELNNKPNEETLQAIKYPNGITRPKITRKKPAKYGKKPSKPSSAHEATSSSTQLGAYRKPYRPPSPRANLSPHSSQLMKDYHALIHL